MPWPPTWMGDLQEELVRRTHFGSWDGYYLAACPHGTWSVWDAVHLVPLCHCGDEAA